MEALQTGPVWNMWLVEASCGSAVHIAGVDTVVVLKTELNEHSNKQQQQAQL